MLVITAINRLVLGFDTASSNRILENINRDNTSFNQFSNDVIMELNSYAPMVSTVISTVFVLMFLAGVIQLGYAMITKTGMNMKTSTGILIGVPLTVVMLRLFFILAFTKDANLGKVMTDFMHLLTSIGFYTSIGMTLLAFIMVLFNKLLIHPGFSRWGKRLFIGSVGLALLTAVMPAVLQNI